MDAKADNALNYAQKECNEVKVHTIWKGERPRPVRFIGFWRLRGVAHRLLSSLRATTAAYAIEGDVR